MSPFHRPSKYFLILGIGFLGAGMAAAQTRRPAPAPPIAQDVKVSGEEKIGSTSLPGLLEDDDFFGASAAALGDLDGDGVADLAVGAPSDDDGVLRGGAIWVLFLNEDGTLKGEQKISATMGGFVGPLINGDEFGTSVAALGDLDGDDVVDLAVGAPLDDDGGNSKGAVWVLFLNEDGTVKDEQKISDTAGGFLGTLVALDQFGFAVASLGDLDGDGTGDLAVGERADDDGGLNRGAVWVLFLNTNGTVKAHQKISDTQGGFLGTLDDLDQFGFSAASPGDLDGDGNPDLAVGATGDDDGGAASTANRGALWLLFLNANGTVKSHQKISDAAGGFLGTLADGDEFGRAAASLGDLDGDRVLELGVGATGDDDGGADRGAAWVLFMNTDGTVRTHQKISATAGGFLGTLDNGDEFGSSIAALGDLDENGTVDLAVGARLDDDGGLDRGAAWVLFLKNRLRRSF